MRYLNHKDILASITYDDMISSVEDALLHYKNGDFDMPERFHYTADKKTLLYMPCFSKGILGTKILTIFPENTNKGLPSIDGIMLLNDYETGAPLGMLDGKLLTALRTGAVGAMGSKYLAPSDTTQLGLIGAGAQGIYQLIYACHCLPITDVYISSRNANKLNVYIQELQTELPDVNFHALDNAESVVKKSQVIITATSSMTPVLPEEASLYKGKTFIAIGSYQPTMRELPDALISVTDAIYVDIDYAKEESGDLKIPIDSGLLDETIIHPIANLIHGDLPKPSGENTILYKSVGMALFDIVVASKIMSCAETMSIGQFIET